MSATGISINAQARFWQKVNKTNGCWLWTASTNEAGYGQFYVRRGLPPQRAHRIAYELLVGPIPDGLVIDHLCRVRNCVNPAHLEPVTTAENNRRGDLLKRLMESRAARTHCDNGHEYTADNVYVAPKTGGRACRTCRAAAKRRYNDRQRVGA